MSESYELLTIQDIFDKVPADRIQDCCSELGQALAQTAALRDLAVAVGAECIGLQWPLVWKDDGQGKVGTSVHAQDESGERHEILRLDTQRSRTTS